MNDDAVRKEVTEAFNAKLRELTGADSLEALQAKNIARRGEFKRLAEQHRLEAEQWRRRYQESQARAAVQAAAIDNGAIDPALVYELLAAQVTLGADESITIGNQGVAEAVKQFLNAKPYLVAAEFQAAAAEREEAIEKAARRISRMHKGPRRTPEPDEEPASEIERQAQRIARMHRG